MKNLAFLILLCSPSVSLGQTYASAIAKMDHIWIGESYNADQASTTVADEVGSNDLTLAGGDNAGDLDGTSGSGPTAWLDRSIALDEANDYFSVGTDIETGAGSAPFTFFFWGKRDTTSGRDVIFGATGNANEFVRFEANNTEIDINCGSGTDTVNPGVTTTDWHSYAFCRENATGTITVYVDGSSVGTATDFLSFGLNLIGSQGLTPKINGYGGSIAGVMVANEELSAAEILALHNGPTSSSPLLLIILMSGAALTLPYAVYRYLRGK